MNTIEKPEARGDGARGFTSGSDAHTDLVDIVLLLVTILILMGMAAGIAIGFPPALEVAATHANAAAVVLPAFDARNLVQREESPEEEEEEEEEYDASIIVDDIRSENVMHAAAPITAPFDRSTPQQSATHR